MFVVLLKYLKPLDIIEQHLIDHRTYLGEGYRQDYFLASGPQNPRTGGVIISQLTDREKLNALIENDPFYIHGIAEYQIIEFDPVKKHRRLDLSSLPNTALLLIEFQNEWLSPSGKLHHLMQDKCLFDQSLKASTKVLEAARTANFPIIHSGLSFEPDYQILGQAAHGLRSVIPKRQSFRADEMGSLFPAPFTPRPGEFVVSGRTGSSAFCGSNLDNYLKAKGIKSLVVMGYALHVCVESTIRMGHDLGYDITLIDDATAAFNQEQQDYFMKNILHHFGSNIRADQFITLLKTEPLHLCKGY